MIQQPKTKQNNIYDQIFAAQSGNELIRNHLLSIYQPFIAKCASEVCKRYIDPKKDDEFSIGLLGFNEAINKYSSERGSSFFSFANLVIKRRIIDYIRSIRKHPVTESFDCLYTEDNRENKQEVRIVNDYYREEVDAWYRREEIIDFKSQLKKYKITLKELTKISPKHKDARESAICIARTLYKDTALRAYVHKRRKIPIKELLKQVSVSKKTLERNRKFILATFIVLSEDYVFLKEYLKGMGK